MKLLSFSDWLGEKDIIFRANLNMFMKAAPLMLAFFWFISGYNVYKPTTIDQLGWVAGLPLSLAGFGTLVINNWFASAKDETQAHEPYNLEIWWEPEVMTVESNVQVGGKKIDETTFKTMEDVMSETDERLQTLHEYIKLQPNSEITYGKYFYHIRLERLMKDHHEKPFDNIILLSPFPLSQITKRVRDQIMLHKGIVSVMPTNYLICTYCNEFQELGEDFRVLTVDYSPQHVILRQMKMGIDFDKLALDDVAPAVNVAIKHVGTEWAMEAREARKSEAGALKRLRTSEDETASKFHEYARDEDFMRNQGVKQILERIPRKWIAIVIGLGILAFIYYRWQMGAV